MPDQKPNHWKLITVSLAFFGSSYMLKQMLEPRYGMAMTFVLAVLGPGGLMVAVLWWDYARVPAVILGAIGAGLCAYAFLA